MQPRPQGLSTLPPLSFLNDKGGREERPRERGCLNGRVLSYTEQVCQDFFFVLYSVRISTPQRHPYTKTWVKCPLPPRRGSGPTPSQTQLSRIPHQFGQFLVSLACLRWRESTVFFVLGSWALIVSKKKLGLGFKTHVCGSTTGELIRPSPVILYDRTRAYACVKTSPGVKCSVNSTFQTLFPTCLSAYLCINNDQKSFSLFEQILFQM